MVVKPMNKWHFESLKWNKKRMREILIVVQGQGKVKQSTYQKTDN